MFDKEFITQLALEAYFSGPVTMDFQGLEDLVEILPNECKKMYCNELQRLDDEMNPAPSL